MADLIKASTHAKIRNAFGDLYDTFFDFVAEIVIRIRTLDAWDESREEEYRTEHYMIRMLNVFDKDGEDGQITVLQKGKYDNAEGYFLFSMEDLKGVGLATDNVINITAATTTVIWEGTEYDIIGIQPIGGLDFRQTLCKMHFGKPYIKGTKSS